MTRFDLFVLPFTIGFVFVVVYYFGQLAVWISQMPQLERRKMAKLLVSPVGLFRWGVNVVKESLLHINLFRTNLRLGYMHMSLAFGWFMLIIVGNFESKVYTSTHINPPYFPIFLEYFLPEMGQNRYYKEFSYAMDLFLLMVLSGVMLAIIKRFIPKKFSIHKKPKLTRIDKIGLTALWLIFPLRFLAESLSAGLHQSGGFVTQPAGDFLYSLGLGSATSYGAWWAYSLSLGVFFVAVPFTRYMHILTEPFFIYMKHAKVDPSACGEVFNKVQIAACSKCGVCLSVCPLARNNIAGNPQPIYMLHALKQGQLSPEMVENCLHCRKCEEACPVGVKIEPLRMSLRKDIVHSNLEYTDLAEYPKAKIGFFAGCMGKLTPQTTKSVLDIAAMAGDNMVQLDKETGICCGRPQKLSGQYQLAGDIVARNKKLIEDSGIEMLVTSCPICLKTFRDDYNLNIRLVHHSQYISNLIESGRLVADRADVVTAFHDPCELSRGNGIRKEPRNVLREVSKFKEIDKEYRGQCCGNSQAHNSLTPADKLKITSQTLLHLPTGTDYLVTGCPACNKAFRGRTDVRVLDIAVFAESHLKKASKSVETLATTEKMAVDQQML